MRSRPFIWILLCLLCLAGAWLLWPWPANTRTRPSALPKVAAPKVLPFTILSTNSVSIAAASVRPNKSAYRLSNTTKPIGELVNDRHAILLENALIDTSAKLNLSIPKKLQSQGDPGAYIVQARGPIDAAFRAMLASAGAEIVSYIPNDAYLVRAQAGVANGLAGNPLTQAVIPYEPYYKIQSSLLEAILKDQPLVVSELKVAAFPNTADETVTALEKAGLKIVAQDSSPFGRVFTVQNVRDVAAVARISVVQLVEPSRQRAHANDLSRATVGVAADTQTTTNYLNLSGLNVVVAVNDSGIDATHPDLIGRVLGSPTTDTSGHGTHVAGIIAGDGTKSDTVTNASGSIMPGTSGQFRGMAPLANLLSMDWNASNRELQEAAARTNALISNNSWYYVGDNAYDLAAASYDAAVRDALPLVTGSQPVLFVFSAGNAGNGDDTTDPGSGTPDSIESPATAKNVITVGAIQEFRNITNEVTNADGTISTPWQADTSTSYRIAGFSSRGNVGIGTEGTFGRYKPDVVAPGTFIVSTRSSQWDIGTYFYQSPTNFNVRNFSVVVQADSLGAGHFPRVPINTVQVTIQVFPNARSPVPFPDLPIYFGLVGSPTYPYSAINQVSIPPDGGLTIPAILSSEAFYGFNYAVSNVTSQPIDFDIVLDTITTNNPGNYFLVYSNLDQSLGQINPSSTGPGPYYRYETGTSMAAADVSGVLALMQDFFTNTLRTTPSPALLKAMLINGARPTGAYDLQVQNNINFEGWGLINLPDSLPPGVTTRADANCSSFFIDQNPTNALATGDRHTFLVTINTNAAALPLRVTLAWTDPPGDPAAAIKLVNNLDLVVTNFDDPANPIIFYGNDIASGSIYNTPEGTNAPNLDSINNVENVFISQPLGANYSITVIGRGVNVNAVTAQTNNAAGVYAPNVVQDFALVISSGNGEATNAFTVTDNPIVSNPTTDQQITFVTSTNVPLLNQLVGASTPLLGTNTIPLGTNLVWGGSNGLVTLGMTNQWHFYVVTNTTGFTNAAFITFIPDTLSIPRMGVFADSTANATRPEADIDLYVTTDPTLMNLNPVAISNCVHGAQVGASSGNIFNGASLGRGGIEFVVDTNSNPSIPGEVYYIGVYSEDQEASEYGFIPIFSQQPFSQMNPNGTESVFGVPLPVNIPDGSTAHPGVGYVFAIALNPMEIKRGTVTSTITHQNFGDLIGTLTHGGQNGLSRTTVLNNHDSLGNPPGPYTIIYDDSGQGNIIGSRPSDGPGSLNGFVGQQAIGPWILTEVDNSLTQTGSVASFQMLIEPHHPLNKGITTPLGPRGWFYEYIDVPPGATSLTIYATNLPPHTGPVDLFVKFGAIPTLTDTNEFGPAGLTNSGPTGLGNSISVGPPLAPGRYWVGLYNESVQPQTVYVVANFTIGTVPGETIFTSSGPVPILDDAVTTADQFVPVDATISTMEVGLRVDHPRVSDLVFHLISPDGTRVLLVENRGGTTTNGMGASFAVTNIIPVSASGGPDEATRVINVASATGTLTIFYNFYSIPDRMVVNNQSGTQIFNSGVINGSGVFNIAYTNSSSLTIVMNPGGGQTGTGWDYTVNALQAYYTYLVLTEDTNKTTTPIKFAPPPFVPVIPLTTNAAVVGWYNSFELGSSANINPTAGTRFAGGWLVDYGNVDVVTNETFGLTAFEGGWSIDLNGYSAGWISTNITTVPGQTYILRFAYARNPDSITGAMGNPPHIPQANVLINGSIVTNVVANYINTWANLNWQTVSYMFTATSSSTSLAFHSLDASGNFSGVLLDAIDLAPLTGANGFEGATAGDYAQGHYFDGWVVNNNQVTVISNATLAYSGTNLLALADGVISRLLPTVPGSTYTLSYAYRGPSAIALWRGEGNAQDATGNNHDGTITSQFIGNVSFSPSEVRNAFDFHGSNFVEIQPIALNSCTFEFWCYQRTRSQKVSDTKWGTVLVSDEECGIVDDWHIGLLANGHLVFFMGDATAGDYAFQSAQVIPLNTFTHVAVTRSVITGQIQIYINGVLDTITNAPHNRVMGIANPGCDIYPNTIGIGFLRREAAKGNTDLYVDVLDGMMDETSIYDRTLSASEIKAIYNHGSAGKYNTNAPSIAQGLAEAQVTLNGTPQPIFFGDNTNWQTTVLSFIATQTNTPLQITGLEPGMLLDNFVMTTIPTNNYDLYYLPEQSLDTLKGENARGDWQLEIWDNRVGATNPAPSLVSWQLRFNFPFTPPTITTITNGQVRTNTVPPGGIAYYLVLVPTNADISTNILFNTTGPLNLIFDSANPPTSIVPPDYLILSAPTGGGSTNLTTTSVPINFAAGGIYYLGVQNPNGFPVNYGIQVNFHLVPPPLTLPQLPELLAITNQLFTVTNSATGGVPPLNYVLTSSVYSGPAPAIDANGVITWIPTASQAPAVYTFTNIVTDSASPSQTATNIFHVLVVLTNGLPAFPGAEGAGGFAIGGRGGDVYHVTTLNDSGPGSLRNGITSTFGSRTIVFDVSGTITLFSDLNINRPYLTIAGQTAPGDGIALQGVLTSVENTHDVVVRFLRCRPGDIYSPFFQDDAFHFRGVTNSIADHISASWSIDEVLSATLSTNVTVQWSVIAEPLNHSAHFMDDGSPGFQAHGYGSLIRYGYGAVSYHHNLYADNYSRNPRPGDNIRLDFVNNVVFNWGIAAGYNEDDAAFNPGGYTNYLNYVGNYFIAGSNTTANPNIAFQANVPNAAFTQIYQATNFIDNNPFNVALNGTDTGAGMFGGTWLSLPVPTPMPEIPVTITNPPQAYEQVLAFAGASVAGASVSGTSLTRDAVDTNIVAGVRNKSGQIIDFISSNSFPDIYIITNFGVTYSGYADAATYWTSQGFTRFVGANPWPRLNPAPQPVDTDQDGLPDYWETTLFLTGQASMNPSVPNNNHSNPDGYTDLEHYDNWLAAPHALTVSNTPVAVDLYAVVGRTGNLNFGVTNGTNGTVSLGVDGHTATFMPTNNYFGFASFGFSVTNLATTNRFDVTVSVMVSATNIVTTSLPLTNNVPQTNTVPANSIAYYLVTVPANAQLATNILISASAPVNLLFSQVGLPTGTNTGDYFLIAGQTSGISLLSTTSTPTNIVPGGTYYLGVQNLNGVPVSFAIEVDFYPPPPTPPASPTSISISSITATNIGGTNGFLLQWQGPTNFQYEIQWTTNLAPVVWNTVLNPVINVVVTSTNGHYSFFDDGTLTGGFGPMKFYRVLGGLNLGPITNPGPATNTVLAGAMSQAVVAVPANAISASNLLISATGPLNVWFNQTSPPTGSTNAGDFLMLSATSAGTFVLTSNSVPPLVPGTNYYLGFQNPGAGNVMFVFQVAFGFAPTNAVSNFSITATNGGIWLKWNGLTNYQYQVQWTTNLAPPTAWNTISNIVLTSTTGIFTFFDDGSLTGGFGPMKFYRLIAWPFMTPIPQTLSISSVTVTNIGGTNDLVLRWSAPTNYQYGIRWTTNLTLPFSNWFIIASPVLTLTNGVYTFIDNGQTGSPASMKFFRLYEYP